MKELIRGVANSLGYDIVKTRNSNAELSTHLANVVSSKNIDCVLDVGANSGQYGYFLRKNGFRGTIISFEPVKAVFDELARNAESDKNWLCYNLALGDQNEDKEINVYKSTVFSSFLTASDYSKKIWNSLETVKPETVKVCRLDDMFEEIVAKTRCQKFYLKMDTQGYDINVFRGAKNSLTHIEALQSELSLIPVYNEMPAAYAVLSVLISTES